MWYPRAEGDHPRKDKLRNGSDLVGEGVVQPPDSRQVPGFDQTKAGLELPGK